MNENDGVDALALALAILALLGLVCADLVLHRRLEHPRRSRWCIEAGAWVLVAAAGVVVFGIVEGRDAATEFGLGYLIETGISIDNVFLWAVVLGAVGLSSKHHYKVLTWSIIGASGVRLVASLVGTKLVSKFEWLTVVFGAVLLLTGVGVLLGRHRAVASVDDSPTFKVVRRVVPSTVSYDGGRMFSIENAKRVATPAFATSVFLARGSFRRNALKAMTGVAGFTLVFVETADLALGFETVPAILSVSRRQLVIFTSATIALLGLRPIYFFAEGLRKAVCFL